MTERRINFGPRYGPELDWVCEDGSPADPDDVGLEAARDDDGCVMIAIGGKLGRETWELTPEQRVRLAAFLVGL